MFLQCRGTGEKRKKRPRRRNIGVSFCSEALPVASTRLSPAQLFLESEVLGTGTWRCTDSAGFSALALRAGWKAGLRLGRTGVARQFNLEQLKAGNQMEVTVSLLKPSSVPSETTGRPS